VHLCVRMNGAVIRVLRSELAVWRVELLGCDAVLLDVARSDTLSDRWEIMRAK